MLERAWRNECMELFPLDKDGFVSPLASGPSERFNLATPRSYCPSCGRQLLAVENIPILSYLMLRGRCSSCKAPIPMRYPAVEFLTGVMTGIAAWHFGFSLAAAGAVLLTCTLVALTFIDFEHQLLPDSITLPCLWVGLSLNLVSTYTTLSAAVIGAIAGYLMLWGVYQVFRLLTGKEGMGYGDFKLTALLGAWLGWQALPGIILLSSFVGAIVGIILITCKIQDRDKPIPFGPYLAAAGWLYLLGGTTFENMYLDWYLN